MSKVSTASKALARTSGGSTDPRQLVAEQVVVLTRVLEPYTFWSKVHSLTYNKIGEASATLVAVRELIDTAEKGRKALTKPLLDRKREIDQGYKAFTDKVDALNGHIGRLLTVAQAEERARLAKMAEKDARKLEKAGAVQAAEDVREAAQMAPVIGGSGLTTSSVVRANVTDLRALCLAIGQGEAPIELVEPRQSTLNALVKAGLPLPPGVERIVDTVLKRTA